MSQSLLDFEADEQMRILCLGTSYVFSEQKYVLLFIFRYDGIQVLE